MITLDDLKAALEGCDHVLHIGTDPVEFDHVAAHHEINALSWLKAWPVDDMPLTGVIVRAKGFTPPERATIVEVENPRLVFARIASKLFPPQGERLRQHHAIGGRGFGFVRNEQGELERFPHYGNVIIGENVEIGHFTCIDRGALTDTIIEDGVKLDNLVHIAHGAHIGAHTSIAALSCIEGSVKIGKRCTIGSCVTFQIGSGCGDDVTVGSGSVVTKFISSGEVWMGSPAKRWK